MDDVGLFSLICLCVHIVLGAITAGMNTSKGYYGGFAWGFFLGIIGIIVVRCKGKHICTFRQIKRRKMCVRTHIFLHKLPKSTKNTGSVAFL